jgi:hypothetical protein
VTQKPLPPADEAGAGEESSSPGGCRVQFTIQSAKEGPAARATATAVLSGTYHESCQPDAAQAWQGDRLPLWRYQTADGHGGRFSYEAFLERRPRG